MNRPFAMRTTRSTALALALATQFATGPAPAAATHPDNVYWGDTHVHTYLSGDAFGMGTRLTPDEAYRFAKGQSVTATGGAQARLRQPLDFLLIADHAENLGALPALTSGDERLLATDDGRRWADFFASAPPLTRVLGADGLDAHRAGTEILLAGKAAWNVDFGIDEDFRREVWHEVIDAAERHNEPGTFTTFAGYEYSSTNPAMLHRNVLFVGGPEHTSRTLPFSKYDSANPEDLWAHLDAYEKLTGSEVISIPHNSNLSRGQMFAPWTHAGDPLTPAYATARAAREPVVEVTQIKGDSETHPLISATDEFADYETWGQAPGQPVEADASVVQSYARGALKLGLAQQATLGANPFKFGMIGSTDSHNGLAAVAEDNFWGKMASNEPGPYRALTAATFSGSGYAAVWAEANTREAVFAAFKRREVYASTGPRITLRFFGGWDYELAEAADSDLAAVGYARGVPMGADLPPGPHGAAPTFLVAALKDPNGANLDRLQVVKGWRDRHGGLHEEVYDVAWSGEREVGRDGRLEPVASTVDEARATYANTVGAAELATRWVDQDFDPEAAAFYYVRVMEIPTPRWTTYDAARYDIDALPAGMPVVIQERAYSSPIWYTPP